MDVDVRRYKDLVKKIRRVTHVQTRDEDVSIDENEEDVKEIICTDRIITFTTELLAETEQRKFCE